MGKVRQPITHERENNHRDFFRDVARQINGGLSLGEITQNGVEPVNIDAVWKTATTPGVVDTEFAVTHNLGRVPVGFDVKRMDKACIVYDSGTAWTDTQIFLKCNVITVAITLFIH